MDIVSNSGTLPDRLVVAGMPTSSSRLRFPIERIARPAPVGASWFPIAKGRLRQRIGRLLNWLRMPGAVRNLEVTDTATGQPVAVHISDLYVRLSVGGRDYDFDRITGRFDGTGSRIWPIFLFASGRSSTISAISICASSVVTHVTKPVGRSSGCAGCRRQDALKAACAYRRSCQRRSRHPIFRCRRRHDSLPSIVQSHPW
jgi:hypothetical protein